MNYEMLMYLHLMTVIPASIIGLIVLLMKKGTKLHKKLGRIYGLLMLITAIIAMFMPARMGTTLFGHFGWIHVFCVVVFYAIPRAYFTAKSGNIKAHKRTMILLYCGAIMLAGMFSFAPNRYLHEVIFG